MRRSEVRTEIESIVRGVSFAEGALDGYINKCILYAGDQVEIPSLKRIDVVKTTLAQAYVPLFSLSGSSGRLHKVRSSTGDPIVVFSELELLMNKYDMDEVGAVEAAALEGSTLWYQKIPEEVEILTVLYYRHPVTSGDSIPVEFPEHLHSNLFVHGIAWMIYADIGRKVEADAQFWLSFSEDNKRSALIELREWLVMNKRHENSSSWR